MELQFRQKCPSCTQLSGVNIIYGSVNRLSDVLRNALNAGHLVLGGVPKWDWEEELLDTKCLECQHEWHSWHRREAETSQ
jgi:hypothetical protein